MASESKTVKLIGLPTALGVTFIVLKLCGVIDWEWLWVLSPFWISVGLTLLAWTTAVVIVVVAQTLDSRSSIRRR